MSIENIFILTLLINNIFIQKKSKTQNFNFFWNYFIKFTFQAVFLFKLMNILFSSNNNNIHNIIVIHAHCGVLLVLKGCGWSHRLIHCHALLKLYKNRIQCKFKLNYKIIYTHNSCTNLFMRCTCYKCDTVTIHF